MSKADREIETQKENLNKLIELMKGNPTLRVVPMVDSDIVGEDGFSWWLGSFGECEIDYLWTDNERVYFKSNDEEDLVDRLLEDMDTNGILRNLSDEELLERAENTIEELEWEKVIAVQIDVAC